jgi:CMP-N,N'-diacetyllegionaminic acid synthase
MKILALIPARAGSKRVLRKNLQLIGSKPLVAWTIDSAISSGIFSDVMVTTDDEEIAQVCKNYNALVPWLRPEYLSTDTANSVDVAIHAIDWYESEVEKLDAVMLLQPTSPFRYSNTIVEAVRLFEESEMVPVVSVTESRDHPEWALKIEKSRLSPLLERSKLGTRSQDLEKVYTPTGSIYLIKPDELRESKTFYGHQNAIPLVTVTIEESLDIDTLWDFKVANLILEDLERNSFI